MAKSQEAKAAEIESMTSGKLLENLLTLHFHIRDAEGMHNFEYANRHKPEFNLLWNETKRRMDKAAEA
jgi:hypothetical protein